MLSIEGRVFLHLNDRSDFTSALAVLLGLYHVFSTEIPVKEVDQHCNLSRVKHLIFVCSSLGMV